MCGTANALVPYGIYGIVWDENGSRDAGVNITLIFEDQTHIVITSIDGSFVFSTMNFAGIENGDLVTISCKHGIETVEINYYHSYVSGIGMVHRRQSGIGVTFNEPSQSAAIAAFLALGMITIPIGNGIYRLFKKKKES